MLQNPGTYSAYRYLVPRSIPSPSALPSLLSLIPCNTFSIPIWEHEVLFPVWFVSLNIKPSSSIGYRIYFINKIFCTTQDSLWARGCSERALCKIPTSVFKVLLWNRHCYHRESQLKYPNLLESIEQICVTRRIHDFRASVLHLPKTPLYQF